MRHARLAPVGILLALMIGGCIAGATPATQNVAPNRSLVDFVDPMIGVAPSRGSGVPGPTRPNGSIHPSPDSLAGSNAGYVPGSPVTGFSQLHAQGAGGNPSYGNLLVSPQVGLKTREQDLATPIDQIDARVGSFACRLVNSNIRTKVAATRHAALYRFEFPKTDQATITIDVARKLSKDNNRLALRDGTFIIDPKAGTITGRGTYQGSWTNIPYDLFYAIELDTPPTGVGTWKGDDIQPGATSAKGGNTSMGAFATFDARENQVVRLKIAVSFKSIEQAQRWLHEEIPAWDMDAIIRDTNAAWEKELSRVTLEGATDAQAKQIYSALRHTMIHPRDRTDDHPKYADTAPYFDEQYTLWDMWKSQYPLMHLLRPSESARVIQSFIERQRVEGRVNTALLHGKEADMYQGGDEVDNILADAYVKQIPGIDWNAAYEIVHANATKFRTDDYRNLGYTSLEEEPNHGRRRSGSATLGYAYNDFCAATIAKGLGKTDEAAWLLKRSGHWRNVWDASWIDGAFKGFIRSRHRDGSWSTSTTRDGHDFYQGTAWNYSFCITQDIPGMIAAMGGRELFVLRLEHAFKNGWTDYTNEPGFQLPWLFAAAGRPDLTSKWVDVLLQQYSLDGYPGDDDSGAMSSLYFFGMAGFFPLAGQDVYYLHGGHVPVMTLHLENGKAFTIRSKNVSEQNIYVQRATVNGRELNEPMIHHADIVAGGELVFDMGPMPSAWGRE